MFRERGDLEGFELGRVTRALVCAGLSSVWDLGGFGCGCVVRVWDKRVEVVL